MRNLALEKEIAELKASSVQDSIKLQQTVLKANQKSVEDGHKSSHLTELNKSVQGSLHSAKDELQAAKAELRQAKAKIAAQSTKIKKI